MEGKKELWQNYEVFKGAWRELRGKEMEEEETWKLEKTFWYLARREQDVQVDGTSLKRKQGPD